MEDQELNIIFEVIELLQVTKSEGTDELECFDIESGEMRMKKIPELGIAETDKEFKEVFDREIVKQKFSDKEIFRNNQILQAESYLEKLQEIQNVKPVNGDLIQAITKYLQWLKSQDKPQEPEKKFFKEDWHWDLINRLIDVDGSQQEYNDYIFYYHAMKGKYSQSREKNDFILDGLRPIDYRNWIKRRFNLEGAFQWKTHHQVESDQRIRRFNDLVKLLDPKNQIINK